MMATEFGEEKQAAKTPTTNWFTLAKMTETDAFVWFTIWCAIASQTIPKIINTSYL